MLACLKARALAAAIGCSASAAVVLMAPNREQKDQKLRQAVVLTREAAKLVKQADDFGGTPRGLHRFGPLWRKYADDSHVEAVDGAMKDLRGQLEEQISGLNVLSGTVKDGTVQASEEELETLSQRTASLQQACLKVLEAAREARTAAVKGVQKTTYRQLLSEAKVVRAAEWAANQSQGGGTDVVPDIFDTQGQKLRLIGLYFSAGWCGPCQRFTPSLQKAYMIARADSENGGWFGFGGGSGDGNSGDGGTEVPFEVLFVSWDRDASGKAQYIEEQGMSWLTMPFDQSQQAIGQLLSLRADVQYIPTLKILAVNDAGEVLVVSEDGKSDIEAHGADAVTRWAAAARGLPWAPASSTE